MARPCKAVGVKSGAITKEESTMRQDIEDKLRGESERPIPPPNLTPDQQEIFDFIVDGLVASDILGRLDVFVLESTAVAIDRLRYINGMMDGKPELVAHPGLQGARSKYQSDLWRGCNELCLSPQARAKIGSLAAQKAKEKKDPLLAALSDDD